VQHWKEGGHDKLCKPIKKAGGAEQYNANKRYAEAVTVAAEKCADDTKGQTCYICTQALHWKTKEGLVRGCSCRGTAGFAHVSCLAEQAKILYAEAEENNLDDKVLDERWNRWHTCSLCEQEYHGVVRCALGWACWKTYVGRPEADGARKLATNQLGNGLMFAGYLEEALSVQEAELSMWRRAGASEDQLLVVQGNLACSYTNLGRNEEAVRVRRDVYSRRLRLNGGEDEATLSAAYNYASTLVKLERYQEAKALFCKRIAVARRVLGESNDLALKMTLLYANALYHDEGATLDDLREAVTTLENAAGTARRVLGGAHPLTADIEDPLRVARAALRAREADDVSSLRDAMEALTPGDA
jgi:hypothetical protein